MVKVLSVCIYVKAKDLHEKITGTAVFFPESFNNNLETQGHTLRDKIKGLRKI